MRGRVLHHGTQPPPPHVYPTLHLDGIVHDGRIVPTPPILGRETR